MNPGTLEGPLPERRTRGRAETCTLSFPALPPQQAKNGLPPQGAETGLAGNPVADAVPSPAEFTGAAIEISRILRDAKVEASLRPRVIGAIILAMYEGEIAPHEDALAAINRLVEGAIGRAAHLPAGHQETLLETLRLSGADFARLSPVLRRVEAALKRLNMRSVLRSGTDFLGLFYEAFLRYGYDNNALGIVFTPRHITRFCVDLLGVSIADLVVDIACGTGGFLVSAYDAMMQQAKPLGAATVQRVKEGIYGSDTNPTVWSLASLNMLFRGDGGSHIDLASCLEEDRRRRLAGRFSRAFLNPPFSQDAEPEKDFIDVSMEALRPGGLLAVVVYAGIFADEHHAAWRAEFARRHSVLGMISLPEDLFYPTAAPTSILIAQAHVHQSDDGPVLMARVWNDGFEKLKNRRVERPGSELPEVQRCFQAMRAGHPFASPLAVAIAGAAMKNGNEWSPQQWLPQPDLPDPEIRALEKEVLTSVYRAVTAMPELAEVVREDFGTVAKGLPVLPWNRRAPLSEFFEIENGKSVGEKHYPYGSYPYVSSGDATNSIIRLVEEIGSEAFTGGVITVTAFGQACLQPWPFLARGNGGSSVRVLVPKYCMSLADLLWFAAQINAQKWRFFYARMAIKGRIERLVVASPPERSPARGRFNLAANVRELRDQLARLSAVPE
jgi:hypothetical protein